MIFQGKWLSTLALGGLVACSSGEGSPSMPPAVDKTAPIADNAPPGDSETAPADEQAPPLAGEMISDTDPSSVSALCTAGCNLPMPAPCDQLPVSECIEGCIEEFAADGPCSAEYIAVLQCVIQQGRVACVSDEEGDIEIAPPEACMPQIEAAAECLEQVADAQPDETNADDTGA